MSNRVIEWAQAVPVNGKTKEVLMNLASTSDCYGRTEICLDYITAHTNLLKHEVIDELEKLFTPKIIYVIGEGNDISIPKNMISMKHQPTCQLNINWPTERFL